MSDEHVTCKECGKVDHLRWIGGTAKQMKERQLCFSCNYWQDRVERVGHPDQAIIDGVVYQVGEKNVPGGPWMRGYGGQQFHILFNDGRDVVTTNLWCNGKVPERFRGRLPDNAIRGVD